MKCSRKSMIVVLINSLLMCCKNCVMIKIKRGLPFCVEELVIWNVN